MVKDKRLYTPTFWALSLSYAFLGGSFNMIIPELPAYLTSLGGEEYKGLIIALFTLTAGLSRPFSGKLADTIGRKPIIVIGSMVCVVCSLLYPILSSVSGFLLLRLIHGFSTGFSPTGITSFMADIVPTHRRGEAMGIAGVSISLGSSITPPIGSFLATAYSLDTMFYASSAIAVLSVLTVVGIGESLENPLRFKFSQLKISKNEIISPSAIFPALVCGFCYFGFGVIITITPDYCDYLGMANKGLFFTSFTICSVLSRLVSGRVSDVYGRIPVMRVAVVMLVVSYLLVGYASSPFYLLAATGLVGFSLGIVIPSVFAWTVDRSVDGQRGRSLATLFIGLEASIGSGALIGAAVFANDINNYDNAFLVTALICLLAMFFVREGGPGNSMKILE